MSCQMSGAAQDENKSTGSQQLSPLAELEKAPDTPLPGLCVPVHGVASTFRLVTVV